VKIILAGAVDITDRVINEPADSFVWSESEGIVFPRRVILFLLTRLVNIHPSFLRAFSPVEIFVMRLLRSMMMKVA
jgi:folate-dependent phosphoribosylglycinamide formyltransferase PurN